MVCLTSRLPGFVVAALLAAPAARAQTGSFTAQARVVSALAVAATSDLAFGQITPTGAKTVAPTTGGRFRIAGTRGQPVSVSFALPANLGAPAVAVGSWAGLANTRNRTNGAAAFVPSAAPASFTLSAGNGRLFLWLGATVTTTGAPSGTYSAPVTVTVVYN